MPELRADILGLLRDAPWRVVRGAFASFVVRSEQYDKNWGSKKPFLEVAVAAPARVIVVSSSPLRRVALRDAMRALSCAPHAIAATFEDRIGPRAGTPRCVVEDVEASLTGLTTPSRAGEEVRKKKSRRTE